MTLRAWTALLRKDWRLFRAPFVSGLFLGALPYGFYFVCGLIDRRSGNIVGSLLLYALGGGAMISFAILILLAAAYGGMAFAAERRDRSAEFLLVLPPSRGDVLASKLAVALTCLLGFFVLHAWLFWLGAREERPDLYRWWEGGFAGFLIELFKTHICAAAMTFGAALLLSTFLKSPTISACISIALVITAGLLVAALTQSEAASSSRIEKWWAWSTGLTGLGSVVTACAYYRRRVEP